MDPHPHSVPRALHRARLWTAGLLTASTLLVGVLGVHLAENRAIVTSHSATIGSPSSVGSDDGSSDDGGSDDGGVSTQWGGFSAVAPLQGSNAQAQSNTGAS